jgi:hypothetical protein
MTKTKYVWSGGAGLRGLKAQQVGEELERIRTQHNGRLTGQDVVEAAQHSRSILRKYFEWDDKAAGAKHRLAQAGDLIRSIEVVVEVKKGPVKKLRAFVSVRRDKDRSYTSVGHAMSDEDLRIQVLTDAWGELEGWRKRYANLKEFAKVHAVIDRLKKPKGL